VFVRSELREAIYKLQQRKNVSTTVGAEVRRSAAATKISNIWREQLIDYTATTASTDSGGRAHRAGDHTPSSPARTYLHQASATIGRGGRRTKSRTPYLGGVRARIDKISTSRSRPHATPSRLATASSSAARRAPRRAEEGVLVISGARLRPEALRYLKRLE